MKNKEFLKYMIITDSELGNHLDEYDYYINYISNRDFEIKDIYLGLMKIGIDVLSILKICMLLCIHYSKKEVDKELIKRLVVEGADFRLRHLETSKSYSEDVREDLVASIMNSGNIEELEKRLRKVQNIKSIKLGDKVYHTQYSSGIVNNVVINIKSLSDKSSRYLVLGSSFDMIRDGKVMYKDIIGIGFVNEKDILIKEDYKDDYLFDYVAYK